MKKLFLFLAIIALVGCNSEQPETNCVTPPDMTIGGQAQDIDIYIDYDGDWEFLAPSIPDWVSFSTLTGSMPDMVTISVETNADKDSRSAKIAVVKAGTSKQLGMFELTQLSIADGGIAIEKSTLEVPQTGGHYELKVFADCKWQTLKSETWVTVSPGVSKNNGTISIDVLPSDEWGPTTATVTVREYGASTLREAVLTINREGKPVPSFKVSPSKRVHLASGNLQYNPYEKKWRIAEPLDYVGEGNKYISPDYHGWIDLFGWGTSGLVSGVEITETSLEPKDYYCEGKNLTKETDWGSNEIKDEVYHLEGPWYTLSKEEWDYMLRHHYWGVMEYNGDYYMFIYCMESSFHEEDVPYGPMILQNYSEFEIQILREIGAAILPLAGFRKWTNVDVSWTVSGYTVHEGNYWTSTNFYTENQDDEDYKTDAYTLFITNTSSSQYYVELALSKVSTGYSVRLAKEAE